MKPKYSFCLLLLLLFIGGGTSRVSAQDWAIKTNIVYDATATVNLGVEVGLAPKWTLDISGNFNAWSKNEATKWKHWFAQPEARYWFCDRFSRHFIGVHAITGAFNFGGINNNISFLGSDFSVLKDKRYQGYAYGAGVAYGFAFMLSEHLNLELEVGLGYMYLDYEVFNCSNCGRRIGYGDHHYVGPTKAAVNLVYLF
jgi:opacity protein-like surface antigen